MKVVIFLLHDSPIRSHPTYIARDFREPSGTQKPTGLDAGQIGKLVWRGDDLGKGAGLKTGSSKPF